MKGTEAGRVTSVVFNTHRLKLQLLQTNIFHFPQRNYLGHLYHSGISYTSLATV